MIVPGYRFWIALAACVVVGGSALAWRQAHNDSLAAEVLALLPDQVPSRPDLVSFAVSEAKPVYAAHCASCHGADMKGDMRIGAPNLADKVWLYGTGKVLDIERTVLYGIRSSNRRGHDVTDMTPFGLNGTLTAGEIKEVVQYVLSLSHRPNLADAALAGREVFYGKGMCGDCHGADAHGDEYYGSPNLTINVWNNGGDPDSLYRSIYSGLERSCPAWVGVLPLEKIRALAVYLNSLSHPETGAYPPRAS